MTNQEQLKTIAGQVLNGPALDTFVAGALMSAFTNDAGEVDEERVMGHLTAIYAAGQPQHQWGQYSGHPAGSGNAGDGGRAALRKRRGVGADTNQPPGPASQNVRATGARAELQKRYGNRR